MSKPFVVLDAFKKQLEAAKSGVIPGSFTQSMVSGVQNVASNIIQKSPSASSGTCYTTFPLSPLSRNVNDLTEAFMNFKFNIAFDMNILRPASLEDGETLEAKLWVGFRDTANIISMLQILLENNPIYTANYFRQESVLVFNSISDHIKETDPQYTTIDKLIHNIKCPMRRITVSYTSSNNGKNKIVIPFELTIDVSRLNPLISNLHYTTPHFGNLKLKLFFQDIAQSLFIVPDSQSYPNVIPNVSTNGENPGFIVTNNQSANMSYYQTFYPFNYILKNYSSTSPFNNNAFFGFNSFGGLAKLVPYKFYLSNPSSEPFFNMESADMIQYNFDIEESEYNALESLFAQNASIVIPTQVYSTNVFNNSTIPASSSSWINSMVGNIGAYNIDHFSIYFTPQSQSTYFQKEFLEGIQTIIDGRPINAIPYEYINDRFIKDSINCLFNDDEDTTDRDYIDSLNFLNLSGTKAYIDTISGNLPTIDLLNKPRPLLSYPALTTYNFKTNAKSAFHSGACILENSNRQANIRFISSVDTSKGIYYGESADKPFVINFINSYDDTNCYFSALCDCCLVFSYDSNRGTCFEAAISYASPFN